jgi:hypothetical protein
MKNANFFKNHVLLFFTVVFLSVSIVANKSNEKPFLFISKQDSSLNFNNTLLTYFNLGLKRIISSSLWISTILESDIDHYKRRDLNSWMYLRFNTISNLEPEFYENYSFGAPYLSIIKDDLEGASLLYKKGIHQFPEDYDLLKNAAYHFYFEVREMNLAYELLKKINKTPNKSPTMTGALARLQAQNGNLNEAFLILLDMQKKFPPDSAIGKKLSEYLYSIKAELDLNCLNSDVKNCSTLDYERNPYIKTANGFVAPRKWLPYRPKWRQ